jgi:hypothetical protein
MRQCVLDILASAALDPARPARPGGIVVLAIGGAIYISA